MMSLGIGSKRRQIRMKSTVDYPTSVSQKPLHRNLQNKNVLLVCQKLKWAITESIMSI